MSERLDNNPPSSEYEAVADMALLQGNLPEAQGWLHEGIKDSYTSDPDAYHHLALKAICLPFYDLVQNGVSPSRLEEAENVWGWIGELMERQLEELSDELLRQRIEAHQPEKSASENYTGYHYGRLSEQIILGLLARDMSEENGYVPLPTSRLDDIDGIDITLVPFLDQDEPSLDIQVKTKLTEADILKYSATQTALIGLSQLDPHYSRPHDERSLISRFIRELQGTASDHDIEALNGATRRMYEIFRSQLISHPSRVTIGGQGGN